MAPPVRHGGPDTIPAAALLLRAYQQQGDTCMDLNTLTASVAAALIRDREISAEDLTRACLARIAARDAEVKAWVAMDPDRAIAIARECDKQTAIGAAVGPLHGLPFGVKDMIDTADLPTQNNSPSWKGHRPGLDANCVRVVKGAGAYVLGKLDTVEFAGGGRKALTRNPFDLSRTPGGSSSGPGAAVADGQVPLAFGTQTAGSLIRPASYNGIYALKPTQYTVSWSGCRQLSPTLDTLGWYGRSPEDLILVARAFRLRGVEAMPTVTPGTLKIGLCVTHNLDKTSPDARATLEKAGKLLAGAGCTVYDLTLPPPFAELNRAQKVILHGEAREQFLPEYLDRFETMHQDFRDRVENREGVEPGQLLAMLNLAARCRETFDGLFGPDLDAVLTFAAPGEAPLGLHTTGDPVMNSMWTVLHAPCVAIPVDKGSNGLPIGIQLVGPRFGDARLLAIAAALAPHLDPTLGRGTLPG